MKELLAPMLVSIGTEKDLSNEKTIYEPKLDGIRALCYVNHALRFYSRNNRNITADYPEFDFRESIRAKNAILDGEIVVLDKSLAPRFELWQAGHTAVYFVFDILMLNGKSLLTTPLHERKQILDEVILDGGALEKVLYTRHGELLWKEMLKRNMEGVIAKKQESLYYPGKRAKAWLKIKTFKTLEALIIGYTTGKRTISSLALGIYDEERLQYIGNVGTGFNQATLDMVEALLQKLKQAKPTVNVTIPGIQWVKPLLICEIKYLEFTKAGILRAPVFLKLRPDKDPHSITFKDQQLPPYR